jgi:molybdenum cofactor cytidylyltransferase
MKFGRIPLAAADGAISAHTLRLAGGAVLKKGRVLGPGELAALRAAGYDSLIAAQLEAGEVGEDAAAARLGAAIAGPGLRCGPATTGRCNLYAEHAGLLRVDGEGVNRLNAIDEAVTLATIAPLLPVAQGELVATVKIIPFAVPEAVLSRCQDGAQSLPGGLLSVAAFVPRPVGLILTRHAGASEGLLDRAASAQRMRLARLSGTVVHELRCAHDEDAVAAALAEHLAAGCTLVLLLGASAIVDRRDVIPAAIERSGGVVEHFGMPVDPGNLLLLARLGAVPLVGVPGCARSLRRSGFDWVLERLFAGIAVTSRDLTALGVGGLLRDIPLRPQPRAAQPGDALEPRVAAVVLAAGLSQRMGAANKLLALVDGQPLVTRVVDTLLQTAARPIIVVTGHEEDRVRAALRGRDVRFCHNLDYAAGMSTSLRTGVLALGGEVDGALICLGDMPRICPAHIEALLGAFDPADGRAVIVPTYQGQRGNPVLWAAQFFPEMQSLTGDVGARALLARHAAVLCSVPMADDGVIVDVDTSEALRALQT